MTACNFLTASFSEGESATWLQATSVFYFNKWSWQAVGELFKFIVTGWQTSEKLSATSMHLLASWMLACPSQSNSLGALFWYRSSQQVVYEVEWFWGQTNKKTNKQKNLFPSQNQFLYLVHCVAMWTVLPHKRRRNRGWKQRVTSTSASLNSIASECQARNKQTTELPIEK